MTRKKRLIGVQQSGMAGISASRIMESIFLAIVVMVFVWLLMHRARKSRVRRDEARRTAANGGEPKSMPRLGTHGTITREQTTVLKKLDFEPDRGWSEEEAALIIDTVHYFRAAIAQETGEPDAPLEIQNNLLGFILTDESLRDYLIAWSGNRVQKGEKGSPDSLNRNEHYERVAERIRELHYDD